MKELFTNPSIEVKNFALENVVTGSTTDVNVTYANAGVMIDVSEFMGNN